MRALQEIENIRLQREDIRKIKLLEPVAVLAFRGAFWSLKYTVHFVWSRHDRGAMFWRAHVLHYQHVQCAMGSRASVPKNNIHIHIHIYISLMPKHGLFDNINFIFCLILLFVIFPPFFLFSLYFLLSNAKFVLIFMAWG